MSNQHVGGQSPRRKRHASHHKLTPLVSGDSKYSRFVNLRVFVNDRLDLTRLDILARGNDHILRTIERIDVPVGVLIADVANTITAAAFAKNDMRSEDYDTLFYVGGHGAMGDFVDNPDSITGVSDRSSRASRTAGLRWAAANGDAEPDRDLCPTYRCRHRSARVRRARRARRCGRRCGRRSPGW